jgi:transcriptional regulator with XRE-family HTH domain
MEEPEIKRRFGERLRELRRSKGLSQEALADQAKLDRTYVSSCEAGKRNISLINIARLAEALGVSPAAFFEVATRSNQPPS